MLLALIFAAIVFPSQGQAPKPATPTTQLPQKSKTQLAKPKYTLPGRYERELSEGETKRTYLLRVPPAYDGKAAVPLVMVLHGWTANAKVAELYTKMAETGTANGYAVVTPDGLGNPPGWNCGFLNLGAAGVDDVKFLSDVLTAVEKELKVDQKRVFVCGHSNGAMMSYVLASKLSAQIAAIGVVSGTVGIDRGEHVAKVAAPMIPVSAIIFHGMLDPTVPYDHGKGLMAGAVSAPDSAAYWAKADGLTQLPAKLPFRSDNIKIQDWKSGKAEVEFVTIVNGTHDWPGGLTYSGTESRSGIDAAEMIIAFFGKHPKRR